MRNIKRGPELKWTLALVLLLTTCRSLMASSDSVMMFACEHMPNRYSYGGIANSLTLRRTISESGRTVSLSGPQLGLVETTAYGPASGREQITVIDTHDGLWGYFDVGAESMIKTDLGGWVGIGLGKYGTEFRLNKTTGELEVTKFQVSYSDWGRTINLQRAKTLFSKNTYKCRLAESLW